MVIKNSKKERRDVRDRKKKGWDDVALASDNNREVVYSLYIYKRDW
jgi:hypothetical protein